VSFLTIGNENRNSGWSFIWLWNKWLYKIKALTILAFRYIIRVRFGGAIRISAIQWIAKKLMQFPADCHKVSPPGSASDAVQSVILVCN
jgi:hypothetical protein